MTSTTHRSTGPFRKGFTNLDIDWPVIEKQLQDWNELPSTGKSLNVPTSQKKKPRAVSRCYDYVIRKLADNQIEVALPVSSTTLHGQHSFVKTLDANDPWAPPWSLGPDFDTARLPPHPPEKEPCQTVLDKAMGRQVPAS